jgi:hypothetical protein
VVIDVHVYDYMYDEGLAILIKNKTLNVYKENLKLELSNLRAPNN